MLLLLFSACKLLLLFLYSKSTSLFLFKVVIEILSSNNINTETSSTKKIRQWILSLKQISKNAETMKVNNIRLYL